MNAQVKLKQFEGPFDLLLNLINEQKLEISEVSLSEVTEQFLTYLDTLTEEKAEEAADFLLVATKLLFLKSKLLLPQFNIEEDEDESLEEQLRLYKAFIEASKVINKIWLEEKRSVFRIEPPKKASGFVPPHNLNLDNIAFAMGNLLNRIKPPKPLPKTHIDGAISMKERVDYIRNILKRDKKIGFSNIIKDKNNKTELIVGFLALLELVKQKTVNLNQDKVFSEIMVESL